MSQKALEEAGAQVNTLRDLMSEDNLKMLGAEAAAKYQQQATDLEARAAELQGEAESGKTLDIYNGASGLTGDLGTVVKSLGAELEQAKAMAAEKAMKKAPARKVRRK